MKSPQKSYLIPPQFARLVPVMIELELQYSAIEALDPGENDRLKKAKNGALKTLEYGLLTIYDEVIYIHRCTTDQLKIKRGKEAELNSCYLKVLEIAIDLFIQKEIYTMVIGKKIKMMVMEKKYFQMEVHSEVILKREKKMDMESILG